MTDRLQVEVQMKPGETEEELMARMIVAPEGRAGFLHYSLSHTLFGGKGGGTDQRPPYDVLLSELRHQQEAAASGDLTRASDLLMSQAQVLDALFTDFTHRALANAGQYPDAMQRYMTIALKAQAQSRTAIEALARMHQPREQVVRHVHVYEGGQAVVAEQLHMHGPGVPNGRTVDQSHAQGSSGTALPSPDPLGNGVPVAGGAGTEALPDARRDKPRRASRKPARSEARVADG